VTFSLSREPTLSRSGHDRAAERRQDSAWLADAWERGQALVVTPEYAAPVMEGPDGPRLAFRPCPTVPVDGERYFLGLAPPSAVTGAGGVAGAGGTAGVAGVAAAKEVPIFAVRAPRDLHASQWADLREIGAALGDLDAGLLTTAVALARWHDRHPRCPICGAPSALADGGWIRRCPVDDSEHFPRTDPAVIMLVHDGGDRCVLGRQASWPPGRYSILAGFVEPGESAEAAVAREVAEEVGLAVADVTYAGSQPWPFPSSLMLGYTAVATGDLTLSLRDGELADALWVSRDEIRAGALRLPPPVSIAHRIITDWVAAG
jgi:NAD+ diphosphatase